MFKNWFPKQQSKDEDLPAIGNTALQQRLKALQAEISERELYRLGLERQISQSEYRKSQLSTEVDELTYLLQEKQASLRNLDLLLEKQSAIEIELSSSQKQKQEYQAQVDEFWKALERQPSSTLRPITSFDYEQGRLGLDTTKIRAIVTPSISTNELPEPEVVNVFDGHKQWESQSIFQNNPDLSALKHIDKHHVVTEAEATNILGSPRSVRKFVGRLEEYSEYLTFSIKIEQSGSGSRYIKEVSSPQD